MTYLSDRILDFYTRIDFKYPLPDNIAVMNPYRDDQDIRSICSKFYHKFYNDNKQRKLILGINPGRLGAGATGIPFTDTKRLNDDCLIPYSKFTTHEPSSVFVYEMIRAYGGAEQFYSDFYINSVCPLGFIKLDGAKTTNYNYYDSAELEKSVRSFILDNIKWQISLAGNNQVCYCLGTGKNFNYLNKVNYKYGFWSHIVPLEHPRYIMQYKAREKEKYISLYLDQLRKY